jgi:3-phenylpropionate/cinnamic acid dioxygenase small subunit
MIAMPTIAEDHAEIRNLLGRYCLLLDHDDVEGWVGLFTPDATFDVYGRTFEGHDGLRRMLSGAPGGLHLGGAVAIDMVGDDHARAQQNLLFIDRTNGESRSAVYYDELARTGSGWRIAARRCRFIVAAGMSDRPE